MHRNIQNSIYLLIICNLHLKTIQNITMGNLIQANQDTRTTKSPKVTVTWGMIVIDYYFLRIFRIYSI